MFDERGCRHALMAAGGSEWAPAEGGVPGPRLRVTVARSGWLRVGLAVSLAVGGLAYPLSLADSVRRPTAGAPETALELPARSLALPAPGMISLAGRVASPLPGAPGSADSSERDRDARWPGEISFYRSVVRVASRRSATPADELETASGRFSWLCVAPSTGPPLSA